MSSVLIKKAGVLIQLTGPGDTPLDPALFTLLHPHLSFEKRIMENYGGGPYRRRRGSDDEDYAPAGPIFKTEEVLMYQNYAGSLVTGVGFLTKIAQVFQKHGVGSHFVDITAPSERKDCYVPDWENCFRKMPTLYDAQKDCLQRISNAICGMIEAATGFGKSFMAEAICHLYPRAKIDYVVPQKDVAIKVWKLLVQSFPNVGLHGGGKHIEGERINVFVADSMHYSDGKADILLADEVHEMMTAKRSVMLAETWTRSRNFGFSATPSARLDKADRQLELYFGPTIYKLSYQDAESLGLVVPIKVRWLHVNSEQNPCEGLLGVRKTEHGIWKNKVRNQAIARDIRENYPDPETDQILILVATVAHAVHLWQYLPEFALCFSNQDADDIRRYKTHKLLPANFRDMTPSLREEYRQKFVSGELRRVIATDVWSTGVDFRGLTVVYRADGRSSEIKSTQAPGRVSRICPEKGKIVGHVIDCYDLFDDGLCRKSDDRRKIYEKLGWEQINVPVVRKSHRPLK